MFRKIVFATVLFLAFLFTYTKDAKASVLFSDDFNDGNANGWDVVGNSGWQVQNGEYGIHLDPGKSNSVPSDYNWDNIWQNYVFEVDIRGVYGTDKNVDFRFKDGTNFYDIHHTGGYIHLEKYINDSGIHLAPAVFYPLSNGPSYHFKVIVEGDHIKVYIDGNLIYDVIDSIGPIWHDGKISLREGTGAVSPTEVWYDNVVVWGDYPTPTIGLFDLPVEYPGRPTSDPDFFKSTFWNRLTAAFDHVLQGGTYRPFTGTTYKPHDCPNGTYGIFCYDGHNGTDFSRVGGENVYSVANGKVVFTSEHTSTDCTPNKGGFGCVVIVQYPDNIYGLYAHLGRIDVDEDENILQSDVIGSMGSTGCPNCGVHLHFGLMKPTSLLSPASLRMTRHDWKELLYQIRPAGAPRYKPFCAYKAPNGTSFTFQDPSGWVGTGTDPWSMNSTDGGCGTSSPYLWKYQIGTNP